MAEPKPIGDLLDTLGVTATLDEGDLINSAVVILSVQGEAGTEMSLAWSDGLDWITRRGLLEEARDIERSAGRYAGIFIAELMGDDDDE